MIAQNGDVIKFYCHRIVCYSAQNLKKKNKIEQKWRRWLHQMHRLQMANFNESLFFLSWFHLTQVIKTSCITFLNLLLTLTYLNSTNKIISFLLFVCFNCIMDWRMIFVFTLQLLSSKFINFSCANFANIFHLTYMYEIVCTVFILQLKI